MRIAQWTTVFLVLLMIPSAVCGAYFAYTQSHTRIEELNRITPLEETDIEKAVRLMVGLDVAEAKEESSPLTIPTEIPFAVEVTAVPTQIGDQSAPDETADIGDQTPITPPETANIQIDPRRTNILLMGIDQRQGETGEFRTDTMIVLSIDPVGKTGAMVSIPRDLWVSVPGTQGQNRINTANALGETVNYPGGGPALAMLTTEKVLGIAIHHYVLVNFDAFNTIIDSIGPVEVCPNERIQDDKYPDGSYGIISVTIEAGCQDMNAETLLQYARTRATSGGDFDRAARQQEVILAVRQKIMSMGGASALLGDSLTIWESISENVKTDLTLDELIELGLAASNIHDIRSGTIGTGEVLAGVGTDGSEILIPIQTDIFALIADLFRPPTRPASEGDDSYILNPDNLPLEIREEAAIIALLNGTEIQGRAKALGDYVATYNLDVGTLGNADTVTQTETYLIYYGDHDASAEYLAHVLATINGNYLPRIERGEGRDPRGDILVIVGTDLAVPQSAETP